VIATSVAAMGDGDAGRAVAVALIVGIVSASGRFISLANVAYFISDSVLVGFKAQRCISHRRNCRSFSASNNPRVHAL
jgi:hypothetical protein